MSDKALITEIAKIKELIAQHGAFIPARKREQMDEELRKREEALTKLLETSEMSNDPLKAMVKILVNEGEEVKKEADNEFQNTTASFWKSGGRLPMISS